MRDVTVDGWLIEERSKSYIAAMSEGDRRSFLERVEGITRDRFPEGSMRVRYETRLWIASVIRHDTY